MCEPFTASIACESRGNLQHFAHRMPRCLLNPQTVRCPLPAVSGSGFFSKPGAVVTSPAGAGDTPARGSWGTHPAPPPTLKRSLVRIRAARAAESGREPKAGFYGSDRRAGGRCRTTPSIRRGDLGSRYLLQIFLEPSSTKKRVSGVKGGG